MSLVKGWEGRRRSISIAGLNPLYHHLSVHPVQLARLSDSHFHFARFSTRGREERLLAIKMSEKVDGTYFSFVPVFPPFLFSGGK